MRLFYKSTTYCLTHITVATTIAYAISGNLAAAMTIGLLEPVVQSFVFALHEWLWEHPQPALTPTPLNGA